MLLSELLYHVSGRREERQREGNIINHVPRKTSNTTMADPSLNKLSPSIRVPSFSDTPYEMEIEIEAETSGFEVLVVNIAFGGRGEACCRE